ncbi:MAG: ABC transporter substrate-binding protein [Firmicutes bacterium]|nr:ABC transporter substrate-binding protein [Bacillota bacterium]
MGKNKILTFILTAIIITTVLLTGCGGPADKPETVSQELVIGVGRDFYNGPESSNFVHGSTGVWESLTYLNENLEPYPLLAEKLVPKDAGKKWLVYLRPNVRFHDGTPLNAEAVVQSVMRYKNNLKLDEYGTFLRLEKVEALGEDRVELSFSSPEPAFPAKVAYHGCPIFSPASFDNDGKIVSPIGTGPFMYAGHKPGVELEIIRNDHYWGDKPRLERVRFKVIPDPFTRLAALQTGEVQAVVDVGGILPEQAPVIEGDNNLELMSRQVTTSHYLLFNNQKPPFDNLALRQAVSLFIDRHELVNQLLHGYGEPAETVFTSLAQAWTVDGLWKTDREEAVKLAARVKSTGPHKVIFAVNSALANRWPYKSIAEVMQSEFKTLGLDVELQVLESGAWTEALKNGDYNLALTPYTLMTGDPDFFFGRWIYSQGQINKRRGIGYSNPEADRLIEDAGAEGDGSLRQIYYAGLQELVARDVPLCPLFHDVCLYATKKEVRDLTIDPFFKPSLDKAWVEQ